MRRRARSRAEAGPRVEMDLTPTIDVTFLLLVFFVCQVRFRQLDGTLDTYLPRDAGAARSAEPPLLDDVRVRLSREDGRGAAAATLVSVNGRTLARIEPSSSPALPRLDRVESALRGFREKRESAAADLDPDPGVPAGHVVAVLDAAIAAGLGTVRFTLPRAPR